VLTKDILFGMNILTLAGFVVMGLTLTLNRMGQTRKALSVGLMMTGLRWCSLGCTQAACCQISEISRSERHICREMAAG
jgi:hypothetical protein